MVDRTREEAVEGDQEVGGKGREDKGSYAIFTLSHWRNLQHSLQHS